MSEYDSVQRMAAQSLAAATGMTIEQALEGIVFQERVSEVIDDIEDVLGEASGDVWFDWSDRRGRLEIGVTTRAESQPVDSARAILRSAELLDRSDFVAVVWSTQELEAAQERANERLEALVDAPWFTARDPARNSIVIEVPDDLTVEQLKVVEASVRGAGVSVVVTTGAGRAAPTRV